MFNRRFITSALALSAALTLLAGCGKKLTPITTGDVVFGNPGAAVTVIEYASLACPGCAAFNNEYFDAFKTKYIDTGQIKFVQREMTTHNAPLSANAFLLARCAGQENYLKVADAVYKADAEMDRTKEYRAGLLAIAKSVGMSEAQFDTCTQDVKAIEAFNARVAHNMNNEGIHSTPTFVINGKELDSGGRIPNLEDLDKAIAEARAAAAGAPAAAAPAAPSPAPAKAP